MGPTLLRTDCGTVNRRLMTPVSFVDVVIAVTTGTGFVLTLHTADSKYPMMFGT